MKAKGKGRTDGPSDGARMPRNDIPVGSIQEPSVLVSVNSVALASEVAAGAADV